MAALLASRRCIDGVNGSLTILMVPIQGWKMEKKRVKELDDSTYRSEKACDWDIVCQVYFLLQVQNTHVFY